MFYVYVHIRLDTGEIFYVGKGQKKRAWKISDRNPHWTNVVNKCGYSVELVTPPISEEEALTLEIILIQDCRNKGLPLVNITEGGDGVSGLVHSKEARVKMSEKRRGSLNARYGIGLPGALNGMYGKPSPNKGMIYSQLIRDRISKAVSGSKNGMYGRVPHNLGVPDPHRGKPRPNRRYTDEEILEIYSSSGSQKILAKEWGCSQGLVSKIKHKAIFSYLWK